MEKSENGYPRRSTNRVTPIATSPSPSEDGKATGTGARRNCEGIIIENGAAVGGCGDCLSDKPLAYSYTPIQKWEMLYSPKDALYRGTLFEALDKPPEVYGNE